MHPNTIRQKSKPHHNKMKEKRGDGSQGLEKLCCDVKRLLELDIVRRTDTSLNCPLISFSLIAPSFVLSAQHFVQGLSECKYVPVYIDSNTF